MATWAQKLMGSRSLNKVIGEKWKGGLQAFKPEWEREQDRQFVLPQLAGLGANNDGILRDVFNVYWPQLSAEQQQAIALSLAETVFSHERYMREKGVELKE
jgi:hypothetical protein